MEGEGASMTVRGWVWRVVVCGMFLPAVCAAPRESRGADFAIWLMSESWSGLTGVVGSGEERLELGPHLWQVVRQGQTEGQDQGVRGGKATDEGGHTPTAARIRREASRARLAAEAIFPTCPDPGVRAAGLPADARWHRVTAQGLVGLRIRGDKVESRSAPRQSRVVAGDQAGAWLAYTWRQGDPQMGDTLLRLWPAQPDGALPAAGKGAGKTPAGSPGAGVLEARPEPTHEVPSEDELSTEWKLVDARQSIGGRGGRVAEFQFEVRQRVRFTLEAARRPGWFLAVVEGELRLSQDPKLRQLVEVDQWWFYDDLEDGR
jgi:hypothetical protein